ncbi:hypothetical protein [Aliiroseovarius sp. xm-m-339-2]|uniref:hypothetical protein n=1 Tax=Aliiroseovarius sp. xm-m-339-2 TaxID=2651829 RepID=UPI00156840F7|nr:hypothetical protein [Aliiroseovarius sp. xm-m-339-2]NRP42781.1 hypothetical protein [Aliiroseovarius sp. xm-m-339-2]
MLFNVDGDDGQRIRLWLTLDHPDAIPEIRVQGVGIDETCISANVMRDDLLKLGLHNTGQTGFDLSEETIPGFRNCLGLQIFETQSGLPIYARPVSGRHVSQRVLLIDFAQYSAPQRWKLLRDRFALTYLDFDTIPLETGNAILGHAASKSMIVQGVPSWTRIQDIVERMRFSVLSVVANPFMELASMLLRAQKSQEASPKALLPLSEALAAVDLGSSRAVTRFFRRLEPNCRSLIRSPMTHALTRSPGEDPDQRDVAVALETLSNFDLVFPDHAFSRFASFLGVAGENAPEAMQTRECMELAALLKKVGPVTDYLSEDISLYEHVSEAMSRAQHKLGELSDGTRA